MKRANKRHKNAFLVCISVIAVTRLANCFTFYKPVSEAIAK